MIIVRKAQYEDIDSILRLLEEVLLVHYNLRKDIFKKEGSKYTLDELKSIIDNPLTPVFVAIENNKVVGHIFCQIMIKEETNNTRPMKTLYIDDICVEENSRGNHIGTTLYSYVKDYSYKNDIYNITLNVYEGNDEAIRFYKKLGMKIQKYTMEEII